jgi:hypothetical protein
MMINVCVSTVFPRKVQWVYHYYTIRRSNPMSTTPCISSASMACAIALILVQNYVEHSKNSWYNSGHRRAERHANHLNSLFSTQVSGVLTTQKLDLRSVLWRPR